MTPTSLNRSDLLQSVLMSLAAAEHLDHPALYERVGRQLGLDERAIDSRSPVGKSGQMRSPVKRAIRWSLQTARKFGLAERVKRGVWKISEEGRSRIPLRKINTGHVLVAFSTDLGLAIWADNATAFSQDDSPIDLVLTSPPYPLRQARAYGNVDEKRYVDFLCEALEPVIKRLSATGSIVLNLSNDIFLPGSPARSTYRERLVIALCDTFGLSKMDEHPWVNRSKPPGPVQWASKSRQQLNVGWEPILWLAKSPRLVNADNRRVLEPHTERHKKLMAGGGEQRDASYSDGAYTLRRGKSYSRVTDGRIPKNVLEMGHVCSSLATYRKRARAAGLPVHGASSPLRWASFYIRFLTTTENLVADPFAGSLTVSLAAELLGRRWIATDNVLEYLLGGGLRFLEVDSLRYNPAIWQAAA